MLTEVNYDWYLIFHVIIIYYYYFYSYTGFTDSLLNWKTSTGPNSAQLPFSNVITQALKTVNVDLELDCLQLLKKNSNNYT